MKDDNKYLYAFDLSLDCTGLVIFNIDTHEHVIIKSFPMKKTVTKGEKLATLHYEVSKLMKDYPPHCVAVEGVYISTVAKNQYAQANRFKSAEALFNCHGVIYCLMWKCPLYTYQPKTIKMIVGGHGDSTKEKVQQSIKNKYKNIKFENNDESDAYGVGVVCMVKEYGMEWERPIVQKKTRTKKKE